MQRSIRRIAVAMSGGVDSSIAALILKRKGYEVTGVHMQNWSEYDEQGYCSGEKDYLDALKVAQYIDIPLKKITFEKEYWNKVFSQVIHGYTNGVTPNPDILCNKYIKFGALFDHVMTHLDVDWLATGHYAKLSYSKEGVRLLKAKDSFKDQTFFLAQVDQHALCKTLFPLGDLLKSEVKHLARACGLERIANKRESYGLCFVGERNFREFINEYVSTPPGEMIDIDTGRIVASHQGIHNWTVGQRTYQSGQPSSYYVCEIDSKTNTIYLAAGRDHPALDCHVITCEKPHWVSPKHKKLFEERKCLICGVRTRHQADIHRCNVYPTDSGEIEVSLALPISGRVAPGQYSVFYEGDECIGSATILRLSTGISFNHKDVVS